jgi:hypothetical protein
MFAAPLLSTLLYCTKAVTCEASNTYGIKVYAFPRIKSYIEGTFFA